jgi:dUTP pyrophosphatase
MIFDIPRVCVVDIVKLDEDVPTPTYGTSMSACFDLCYFPDESTTAIGYNKFNMLIEQRNLENGLRISAGDRVLVPTGLIFRTRERDRNMSLRLHPRSGLSLKRGLVLANSEGVVDADYQEQVFVILHNISEIDQYISRGERICQGEFVSNHEVQFNVVETLEKFSERSGGFGSTGV